MKLFRLLTALACGALLLTAPTARAAKDEAKDAPKAEAKDVAHKATVIEAKTAGGYTYLKVKEAGKERWLAALPMEVAPGDTVEFSGGDTMTDFKSKAMNQTFESIHFVARIHVPSREMPMDQVHQQAAKASAAQAQVKPPKRGDVARAKGGKTIEELFKEKDQLAEKSVVLRARVMKISRNILGKNWVTLADGTGQAPDNALVVVTKEAPAIGDTVTVTGTVKANVDLGSGYHYKAMIDDGKFIRG